MELTYIGVTARWAIGGIFLIAAGEKVAKPEAIVSLLAQLGIRPAHVAAWAVIGAEVLLGCLMLTVTANAATWVGIVTLVVFSAVHLWARRAGIITGCLCFGRQAAGRDWTVVRNSGLVALLLLSAGVLPDVMPVSSLLSIPCAVLLIVIVVGRRRYMEGAARRAWFQEEGLASHSVQSRLERQ